MSDEGSGVTFDELGADATSGFRVTQDGTEIGIVRPFRLGAGQFGSGWAAEDPSGAQSTGFPTREAAADWLVERAGRQARAGQPLGGRARSRIARIDGDARVPRPSAASWGRPASSLGGTRPRRRSSAHRRDRGDEGADDGRARYAASRARA